MVTLETYLPHGAFVTFVKEFKNFQDLLNVMFSHLSHFAMYCYPMDITNSIFSGVVFLFFFQFDISLSLYYQFAIIQRLTDSLFLVLKMLFQQALWEMQISLVFGVLAGLPCPDSRYLAVTLQHPLQLGPSIPLSALVFGQMPQSLSPRRGSL